MEQKKWLFIVLIIAATLTDVILGHYNPGLRIFSKPVLIPLIMWFYWTSAGTASRFARLFLIALFFSWLGDLFLLFEDRNSMFFIFGLSSFLTAHILYILYFSHTRSNTPSFFKKRPVMFLAVVAYVVELLYILWPQLGGLRIPVLVYALVIGTMLTMALWQYGKLENRAAVLFIIGAFLFVLSDSALALNRFYQPYPLGGAFVMITYVAAQACLALGSIAHLRAAFALTPSEEKV